MTVTLPETTKVLGTRSVWIIPEADVADPTDPTVAEMNGGFKATCYVYSGGIVTGEQTKGTAPRKECEITEREQLGTVKSTISDIQYSYKPQAADADDANAMKAAMVNGTRVIVVERLGVLDSTALAAGQFANSHVATLGIQNRTKTGDDEYAEYSITQGAVVESSEYDIVLTAA